MPALIESDLQLLAGHPPNRSRAEVAINALKGLSLCPPQRTPGLFSRRVVHARRIQEERPQPTLAADELQALIATSREERAALSTMLTQIQLHSAKLATRQDRCRRSRRRRAKAHTRLDEVTERLAKADARAKELEAIDARIRDAGRRGRAGGAGDRQADRARRRARRSTSRRCRACRRRRCRRAPASTRSRRTRRRSTSCASSCGRRRRRSRSRTIAPRR